MTPPFSGVRTHRHNHGVGVGFRIIRDGFTHTGVWANAVSLADVDDRGSCSGLPDLG